MPWRNQTHTAYPGLHFMLNLGVTVCYAFHLFLQFRSPAYRWRHHSGDLQGKFKGSAHVWHFLAHSLV